MLRELALYLALLLLLLQRQREEQCFKTHKNKCTTRAICVNHQKGVTQWFKLSINETQRQHKWSLAGVSVGPAVGRVASCGTSSQFLGDWRRLLVRSQVKLDFLIKLVKVFVDQMTLTLNYAAVGSGCRGAFPRCTEHFCVSLTSMLFLPQLICSCQLFFSPLFCLIFCSSGGNNVTHPRNVSSPENAVQLCRTRKYVFEKKKLIYFFYILKFLCFFMCVHTTD